MITLPYNITCGYFDCSEFGKLTKSPKRMVNKFEIEFYLEDALSTFVDDKEYSIKKHYIQIAKPGQIRYTYLPFKTMYIKFCVDGQIADMLNGLPEYFYSQHAEKIIDKLNQIILLNEDDNELLLQSQILSFLNLILYDSKLPNIPKADTYEVIEKAKRFIETQYKNPITLNDIAKAVNLSPIYFHNIFSKTCCITPHDYLINCRINEAKKQLWNSSFNLDFVAQNCGFGCAQYFNRIFKKNTGMTPGKYRKEVNKKYFEDLL